jgi:hypothetical protein
VLEGSVRKSGDVIRITAQLIRVSNGYHLWSETYDRRLDDIFKIQDDIANAVVQALKASLLERSVQVQEGLRESSQSRPMSRRESSSCRRTPPRHGLKLGLSAAELGKSRGAFPLDECFEPLSEHCRTIKTPQST